MQLCLRSYVADLILPSVLFSSSPWKCIAEPSCSGSVGGEKREVFQTKGASELKYCVSLPCKEGFATNVLDQPWFIMTKAFMG